MALNIKDPETDRLARQLAKRTGETLTEAVTNALRERLTRVNSKRTRLSEDLLKIGDRLAKLRPRTNATPDEIIGYDEHGLPR